MLDPRQLAEIRSASHIVGMRVGGALIYKVNVSEFAMERAIALSTEAVGPEWHIHASSAPNGVPSYLIYTTKPEWFVEIEMQIKGTR